eukprot:TRINITY_DN32600_c0_g1_i2.p1 TRINITY_DN32600_c0_g1~~TRINITY_DN32600_c0_g1_i2.p1  ORF type:complete len:571 (-),score=87.85 TRINITY_DN32600_c0_g1_i2:331-1992(-)
MPSTPRAPRQEREVVCGDLGGPDATLDDVLFKTDAIDITAFVTQIDALLEMKLEKLALRLESSLAGSWRKDVVEITPVLADSLNGSLTEEDVQSAHNPEVSEHFRDLPSTAKARDLARKSTAESIGIVKHEQREAPRPRTALQNFVGSTYFELFCTGLIVLNSICLGIEIQYHALTLHDPHDEEIFLYIRVAFSLLFLVELLLRIAAGGTGFFCDPNDRKWNLFDLVLVISSLPELVGDILTLSGVATGGSVSFSQLRLARMMKVLRLIRVVRSPSVVKWVRPLHIMIISIMYTLKALAWILVLFALIMYMFSIVIVQSLVDTVKVEGFIQVQEKNPKLLEFWGDLGKSMMTLWESVAGGISWHEVITPLFPVDMWLVYVFCAYVFFTFFCVFNVVTGVFCNSAIEAAAGDPELQTHNITRAQMMLGEQIKAFFMKLDNDGSGIVTFKELQDATENPEMIACFESIGLGIGEAWELFKLMDADGSNTVDIEEFVTGCMKLKGAASSVDTAFVRQDLQKLLHILEGIAVQQGDPLRRPSRTEHARVIRAMKEES